MRSGRARAFRGAVVVIGALLCLAVLGLVLVEGTWIGRSIVRRLPPVMAGERFVAITIDDGPDTVYTQQMLSVLRQHGATATFFVVGREVRADPSLAEQIVHSGASVGSHTWSHPHMDVLDRADTLAEVSRGVDAITDATGVVPRFYRPPRGVLTPAERFAVRQHHMQIVMWDECLDSRRDRTPKDAVDRVMRRLIPGDIILLHDGLGRRAKDVEALGLLLDRLDARGYRTVPLDEIQL